VIAKRFPATFELGTRLVRGRLGEQLSKFGLELQVWSQERLDRPDLAT
jgi:hypothetical protein